MTNDSIYNLFTITGSGQNPIVVELTVNNLSIQMELDTGTSLWLLNKQTYTRSPNFSYNQQMFSLRYTQEKSYTDSGRSHGHSQLWWANTKLVVFVVKEMGPT